MIILFQNTLFLKEFLACYGCFGLFSKIKKGNKTHDRKEITKFGLKMFFFFPFTITAFSRKLNYLFFHHSYLSAKTSNDTSISVGMGSKHLKVNKVNRKTFLCPRINICMIAFAIDLLLHDQSFLFQNYWNWISFRSHLAD